MIKVAVLDTGLDIGHPDIQAARERIKAVWSWVHAPDGERQTKPGDPCGHGTHVTSLLLGVAPDCDIYVAQIADSQEPQSISANRIAKVCQKALGDK
jgi:subtilisin family serine protease